MRRRRGGADAALRAPGAAARHRPRGAAGGAAAAGRRHGAGALDGDVPLIGDDTLRALVAESAGRRLALLTIELDDPTGYGRIVRARARRGARPPSSSTRTRPQAQRAIREVYSGVMAVPARLLKRWLARLDNDNAQGEYYLTDSSAWPRPTACRWWRIAPTMRCRWPASTARRSWPPSSAPTSCARPTR